MKLLPYPLRTFFRQDDEDFRIEILYALIINVIFYTISTP
jgi:hypothetical protein